MSNEGTGEPEPAAGPAISMEGPGLPTIEKPDDSPEPESWRRAVLTRTGLAVSVLAHLCLVLWAVGWLGAAEKPAEQEAIAVTLVPEEEAPQPEAPKPQPPEPPATPPRPEPAQRTPARQNPQEERAAQAAAKPPEPVPMRAPPPAPPAPAPPSERQPAQSSSPPAAPEWPDVLASLGMAEDSRPTTLSQEELDAVRAQAKRCWKIPAGWSDSRQVTVTIRFQLKRDGTVAGSPSVVSFPASELGKSAALNAMQAVTECGPFRLPADKYEQWKDVQLRFEP